MKILKADFENTESGLVFTTPILKIFFGKKKSSLDSIQSLFPQFCPQRIKQTHSDLIVQASDQIVEADSHFSAEPQTALLISTADCLPVMIFCEQTKRIAAVHAGWKGVANQIVLKTLQKLIQTGSSHKAFQLWIGPHILQNSFEIDSDVLKQLEAATYSLSKDQYCYEKNSKFYVDLNQIIFSQVAQVTSENTVINCIDIDTKTDLNFWSHRRDKDKAGRNLSFICLL